MLTAKSYTAHNFELFIMLFFVTVFFSSNVFGSNKEEADKRPTTFVDYSVFSEEEYSTIEKNLLNGLNSDNHGLRISSAYFLGEMKSDLAIIPLMKLLSYGETEYAKIVAAISLYKIGSARGMYRIKWLSEREDNEMLRKNYERIYATYQANKNS